MTNCMKILCGLHVHSEQYTPKDHNMYITVTDSHGKVHVQIERKTYKEQYTDETQF